VPSSKVNAADRLPGRSRGHRIDEDAPGALLEGAHRRPAPRAKPWPQDHEDAPARIRSRDAGIRSEPPRIRFFPGRIRFYPVPNLKRRELFSGNRNACL